MAFWPSVALLAIVSMDCMRVVRRSCRSLRLFRLSFVWLSSTVSSVLISSISATFSSDSFRYCAMRSSHLLTDPVRMAGCAPCLLLALLDEGKAVFALLGFVERHTVLCIDPDRVIAAVQRGIQVLESAS